MLRYQNSRFVLSFLQAGQLTATNYENDDADIFFPKKGYRKATVNASTANRKLHYIEEGIRRNGNVPLGDALAEMRCIYVFRVTELFIGERQPTCVESHFEERRCQITAPKEES